VGKRPSDVTGADALDDNTDMTANDAATEETYVPGIMTASPFVQTGDTGSIEYQETEVVLEPDDENGDIEARREEIERTRAQMSSTIDAIQSKLSPDALKEQAKDAVMDATVGKAQQVASGVTDTLQNTVGEAGGSFIDTIRENPIPAALAGIGIGWLVMSFRGKSQNQTNRRAYTPPRYGDYQYGRRPAYTTGEYGYGQTGQGRDYAYYEGDQSGQSGVSNMAGQAQDAVSNAAGQVQDAAGNAVNQVQNVAGNAVNQVQGTAGQVADQAQTQFYRAETQLERWMTERPLAVTAGAVALGIALGAAIPETQKEDELMGEARENLMDRAQQVVRQQAQKVEAVASDTLDAAKNSAQQQGLAPDSQASASSSSSQSGTTSSSTGSQSGTPSGTSSSTS
jgi:hypothetical protein